jgi:hypothetical protein
MRLLLIGAACGIVLFSERMHVEPSVRILAITTLAEALPSGKSGMAEIRFT